MHQYVQSSRMYLFDRSNATFIKADAKKKPFVIDVPFYFWNFKDPDVRKVRTGLRIVEGRLKNTDSYYRKVNTIKLNKLLIHLGDDMLSAKVEYFDVKRHGFISIAVHAAVSLKCATFQVSMPYVTGLRHTVKIDNEDEVILEKEYYTELFSAPNFCVVGGLAKNEAIKTGSDGFYFGLIPDKYDIQYKDVFYDKKFYAFLCGSWAILLNDKFEFNSIVTLSGATSVTLVVDKFVHTVDKSIVKFLVRMN